MADLERLIRDGLATLAEETETTVPLARRARAGRRRRTRRLVGAAAVAAVLVVAGGAGVTLHRSGSDARPTGVAPTDRASDRVPAGPGSYRLEVWQDLGVYVPATWGWGGAPGACGVGATVAADGYRLTGTEHADDVSGYVGRPVAQAAHCPKGAAAPTDTAVPYVWLGADVPQGRVDLGGGFVRETRVVGGVHVTVGSRDAAQRRVILDSAQLVPAGPCPAWPTSPPSPSGGSAPGFVPLSMTVCAYAPASSPSIYQLVYREELTMGPAKQLVHEVARAAPMGEFSCYGASGGEWALLHLAGEGGQSRDYVVDLSCPSIADPTGLQHRLTSADVLPWAADGVNAVLHANPLIDVPGRLIPR